ncbi:MAG: hypothetical protein IKF72_13955 [Kiritimatiellae bacterium]|nr:hypothetical protein [Kiritimatiellia bacterium]
MIATTCALLAATLLGISNEQAVQRLLELARDAGGDGITMEVVDFNNYSPAVCKSLREF